MGTMCTPNYANTLKGKFEKNYIYLYTPFFQTFTADLSIIYSPLEWNHNTNKQIGQIFYTIPLLIIDH